MGQQKQPTHRIGQLRNITAKTLATIQQKHPQKYKRIMFNIAFLRKMKEMYKKLHCVYCNRYLIIYEMGEYINKHRQATADHFLPRATNPELEYDDSNLRVCCHSCNGKKGADIWEEKYPYPKLDINGQPIINSPLQQNEENSQKETNEMGDILSEDRQKT